MKLKSAGHIGQCSGPRKQHWEGYAHDRTCFKHYHPWQIIKCLLDVCYDAAKGQIVFVSQLYAPEQMGPNLPRIARGSTAKEPLRQVVIQETYRLPGVMSAPATK